MIVYIDSMPQHLIEYLFIWNTDDIKGLSEVPVLLNGGLAIQEFEGEVISKSSMDIYIGPLSYIQQRRISNKYQDKDSVVFADLTKAAFFGNLITKHRINIQFSEKEVMLCCDGYSINERIENIQVGALKVVLKSILKSDTADVSQSVMDVMNQYTAQLNEQRKRKIVLH